MKNWVITALAILVFVLLGISIVLCAFLIPIAETLVRWRG